ncbi:MAG: hypothetical protein U0792_18710 [Gemmataceae bacterium]
MVGYCWKYEVAVCVTVHTSQKVLGLPDVLTRADKVKQLAE